MRQARKDVEGSLFVVKRRSQPRFQFVVLNQRSTGTYDSSARYDSSVSLTSCYLMPTLAWRGDVGMPDVKAVHTPPCVDSFLRPPCVCVCVYERRQR